MEDMHLPAALRFLDLLERELAIRSYGQIPSDLGLEKPEVFFVAWVVHLSFCLG